MHVLFKLVLWLIMLSPIALATVAWFALEEQPLVGQARILNHADIARARRIIKANDPRKFPAGAEQKVRISERDLNLVANYLLQRVGGTLQARVVQDAAQLSGSVHIPGLPLKPYLNISLRIADSGGKPRVSDLHIGRVPVPDPLTRLMVHTLLPRLYQTEQGVLAGKIIRKMDLSPGNIAFSYRWQPNLIEQARDTLIDPN